MAIVEKERILIPVFENIPDELKSRHQWILWKAELNEKSEYDKVPYQINGVNKASSTNKGTWSTFKEVEEAYENGIGDGIGFVLTNNDPYACIDIDGLSDVDYLPSLVQRIVDMSYAELSVSGSGIHVWVRFQHDSDKYKNKNNEKGFEIYNKERFITFTGEAINELTINESYEIEEFINEVFKREESLDFSTIPQNIKGRGKSSIPEERVITLAIKGKNGDRFNAFLNGGWENILKTNQDGELIKAYPSPSEARMAFLNDLAFWTNCDYGMMDSIFRQSSLMLQDPKTKKMKWDRNQSGSTLGDLEIKEAIRKCKNTYIVKKEADFRLNVLESEQSILPKNYISRNGCLYKVVEKEVKGQIEQFEVFICRQTPIISRSFMNVEYPQLYHELTWSDKGKVYKEVVPAGDLAIKRELLKLSYKSLAATDNNAKHLIEYFDKLNMVNKSEHSYLVERLGHIKNTFIHPLRKNEIKILPTDIGEQQMLEAFSSSGTSDEWIKNVLEPLKKHPRALLIVLASFASVILKDLELQPFIVDFSGPTSRGKTTILKVCASVWGTDQLVNEWNLTKVAGERKAAFLNSFPLILDDTKKADERQLQAFIYNFSGGRSKGRGSVSGSQRELTWNNILLSTGENSLTEYAEKSGGVAARIVSITGIPFEDVDFLFFNNLYNSIKNYHGTVGLEFLDKWREHKDKIIHHFTEYNEVFQKKAFGNEVISRIARYYTVLTFTGKLLNTFFNADINLIEFYKLFDELVEENKSVDKPKQLLVDILQDLDSDRVSVFYDYLPTKRKAAYHDNQLYLMPKYLKEFLGVEMTQIRSEWMRKGITYKLDNKGKINDWKQFKHKGEKMQGIPLNMDIVAELGFDFSIEKS